MLDLRNRLSRHYGHPEALSQILAYNRLIVRRRLKATCSYLRQNHPSKIDTLEIGPLTHIPNGLSLPNAAQTHYAHDLRPMLLSGHCAFLATSPAWWSATAGRSNVSSISSRRQNASRLGARGLAAVTSPS